MSRISIIAVLPLILILPALPGAEAVSAGYPDLFVEVEPPVMSVNYSQYEQKVRFDGSVTLDNPSNLSVQIMLWAGAPFWSAICSPDVFTLQDSSVQRFNLTVTVPAGSSNRTVDLWVNAEAYLGGQVVSTNRSNKVTTAVGGRPVSGTDNDRWFPGFGGGGPASGVPSVIIAVTALAAVAAAGFGLARRRRRRREARQ